tara:strand:- start:5624 stop:5842 length:219 start_codon:yes stop_codon:yes gene_type:complete
MEQYKNSLWKVKDWNYEQRKAGNYIMSFNLGNGAYLNEPRKRGYVVQNGGSVKFISNYKKAMEYFNSIRWND